MHEQHVSRNESVYVRSLPCECMNSTSESVYVRLLPCIESFVCMSSTYPGPRVCVCVCAFVALYQELCVHDQHVSRS